MSSDLTVSYMAEQMHRGRLDGMAARGWLAEEAAATRSCATRPAQVPAILSAALIRLGERLQRTAQGEQVLQHAQPAVQSRPTKGALA